MLASAIATPVVGRLGDMYGKRRMLLISLAMLVAGSVVAGLGDTLTPLIVGRALQGLAAGVIPLGISIMRDELSASLGVGGALGLPAAALLAERTDWHVLFWVAAGLGVLAAVLVLNIVPESSVRSGGRFDLVGAAGLSTGLCCLLLAISNGAGWGWASALTAVMLGGSAVALLLWGWWELRTWGRAVVRRSTSSCCSCRRPPATGYGLGRSMLVAPSATARA